MTFPPPGADPRAGHPCATNTGTASAGSASQAGPLPAAFEACLTAFETFLAAERGFSSHTVRAYLGDARSLLVHAWQAGAGGPDDVGIGLIRGWLAGQHASGQARSTLARRGAAVRTFTAFGHRRGLLAADPGPLLGTLKTRRGIPHVAAAGDVAAVDHADVLGQPVARRAVEICAAGGHHLSMLGPPGAARPRSGHLIDAACARGEQALLVLFEESPEQVIRNMRSVGLDLRRWAEAGLLRMWAARPMAFGLETHLAILARLVEAFAPSVAVLDGIASLTHGAAARR